MKNFYESKHVKYLFIIPLVLILLSLFFIPSIPRGVDLKGGILLTIQTDKSVDAAALQGVLAKYSQNVNVREFSNPSGNGVEIEVENPEKLDLAEQELTAAFAIRDRLEKEDVAAASTNSTAPSAANAELITQSKKILALLGSNAVVSQGDGRKALSTAQDEFSKSKQDLRNNLIAEVGKVASVKSASFQEVGSSLSKFFVNKTREIVITSFLLVAIVILIVFWPGFSNLTKPISYVPSAAVLFGAAADLIITLGVMGALGIPLSLATIATLLMLIGFSIDTDVMLTMRVIKRKGEGTPEHRTFEAFKTGSLMNLTTIGAYGVLYLTSFFLQAPIYAQIGIVALIGGAVDFIATWGVNAVVIMWYAKKKNIE